MKTILGAKVKAVEIYKNAYDRDSIAGTIWTEGQFNILIRKGKFFLQDKDAKSHGLILKGTTAHRKIKRVIAIWFRTYRKNNPFLEDNSYMRSRCIDSIHNLRIQRIKKDNNQIFQLLGDMFKPETQKQFS